MRDSRHATRNGLHTGPRWSATGGCLQFGWQGSHWRKLKRIWKATFVRFVTANSNAYEP